MARSESENETAARRGPVITAGARTGWFASVATIQSQPLRATFQFMIFNANHRAKAYTIENIGTGDLKYDDVAGRRWFQRVSHSVFIKQTDESIPELSCLIAQAATQGAT